MEYIGQGCRNCYIREYRRKLCGSPQPPFSSPQLGSSTVIGLLDTFRLALSERAVQQNLGWLKELDALLGLVKGIFRPHFHLTPILGWIGLNGET